jgi:enamine deaminase RidA (YjgF/YER057c/UK114 family)
MSQDTPIARLKALGLELPKAPAPAGNYVPFFQEGSLLFLAGQLPYTPEGVLIYPGKVGESVTLEEANLAARQCALNILAQVQAALGDLGRVKQFVRLNGYVAAAPDFTDTPLVMNGASDLLAEVLGEAGRHTRVAVGVASLPRRAAVEIDAIVAVK